MSFTLRLYSAAVSLRSALRPSETQRKRSLKQRMTVLHVVLGVCLLIVVARLLELQLLRGSEYRALAQAQHYGGVVLPARRGEILSVNSKTGEASILATNTTLDMVYVDPLIVDDATLIAESLADILVSEESHAACMMGNEQCPHEFREYFADAFDPLLRLAHATSGTLLEPVSLDNIPIPAGRLPDLTEMRRLFARDIEQRISQKRVRYVPLVYGADKQQMQSVSNLQIQGITVSWEKKLIYADPEEVDQLHLTSLARQLAELVDMDADRVSELLRSRPLRYVPVMHRLPPMLTAQISELQLKSKQLTAAKRREAPSREAAEQILDPFRCIALIPEHWRYYPDSTVASHVVGFLNTNQEPQYGVERTFNPQLRGQEGRITAVSDPAGGQIVTGEQSVVDPKDGDTVVLTIDRTVQQYVEEVLAAAVDRYEADSGQAIVLEPQTGRIIAMVNAPLFDSNDYSMVYEKTPIELSPGQQAKVVVELYHPEEHTFILKGYLDDVFTASGRSLLSETTQSKLAEVERLYDIRDIARYYMYVGEHNRWEVFPTDKPDLWLLYSNKIGVGAYLNRTIQEIYEPGSVFKPITMAIALDQGEVTPTDIYDDTGPVEVDEYTIKNALLTYYGKVTMTDCLAYSINTCMTSVSAKLGQKLFERMIERFGFGQITGIELEDELPGEVLPWKNWSRALLATAAFGQGISATPLQVVTAFSALANGGKLMRPTIIDRIERSDGTVERTQPHVVDRVITQETSETITAMLTNAVTNGYAKKAKVPGYRIAGKTGTSQIAGPGGKYETGTGSTVASFVGYAPIDDPLFVALVKLDRPLNVTHGAEAAAPVFQEIAAFLLKYYGVPPDDL